MEKIAVIDLGSNSARLVLANMLEGGYFVVFDELKETVRLGQDMEREGFLKPSRIAQAVKTLKMFKKLIDINNVDKVIAVATSAVRRAKNQKSFLEEVYSTCGFKIKVLTPEEEASYIYQGVINSFDIPKGLIVEISGGTTQLIYYNRRNILAFENLPFGAITLTALYNDPSFTPEEQAEKIEEFYIDQFRRIPWLAEVEAELPLIGVGGSFRNLGKISRRMIKYPLEMAHNYFVPRENFTEIYDTLRVLGPEKRMKIKGLSAGRADIFISMLSCVSALLKLTPYKGVTISGSGLREGLMLNHAVPTIAEKPLSDVLGHSLNTLVRHFDIKAEHADHVYDLSIQLYKQLRVLHKLPRQYIKVLRVAAVLHDSGMRLKFYDHQKHSRYIILNSNLYGISHRDLILAAFVADAHRKDDFDRAAWAQYKDVVREDDYAAVRKLGVILKIAESLDRSESGGIKSINCDVLGDSVIMKTEVEGDCNLEIMNALGASVDFYRAYGKNLEIL
ncbi:MAG: Ppx/GppA family phosphatase [Clostridiales bacterium]|nr:Ppx/GppA family phosphatase [Clostridiales bacterium]